MILLPSLHPALRSPAVQQRFAMLQDDRANVRALTGLVVEPPLLLIEVSSLCLAGLQNEK